MMFQDYKPFMNSVKKRNSVNQSRIINIYDKDKGMRSIQDILKGTIRRVKSSHGKKKFKSNMSLLRLKNKTKALTQAMNIT